MADLTPRIRLIEVNAITSAVTPFTPACSANQGLRRDDVLFRSVKDNVTGEPDQHIDPASVYRNIVRKYGLATGIGAEVNG